jgi:hypothetical protein
MDITPTHLTANVIATLRQADHLANQVFFSIKKKCCFYQSLIKQSNIFILRFCQQMVVWNP